MLLVVLSLIKWLIGLYETVLFIRVLFDWVFVLMPRWRPGRVIGSIINVFYVLTDPPLRWLRRFIPVIRMGSGGLDVTPMVLWFILAVVAVII
ncbi:YggT family protein [Bifidobacterium sp. ESL0745]|uniref:YggT family protein n=1 Tax=Bifidobacterium sp. ESL0745 TaxID=2983226 RepID=UPI0023F6195D|nr:YggT family protein [Bifidobacterium sp. ESL0745]MDF7664638.1 YggT family protein [Bifidobacterium sp. ESL0745]